MQMICPDEEIFADYIEGRLSMEKRSEIEEHLSGCDICRDYFIVAERLIRENERFALDRAPAEVTQAAVSLVKNLDTAWQEKLKACIRRLNSSISDFMTPLIGSHPAAVRSFREVRSNDCITIKKTFKKIKIEFEIERTGNSKANIRVRLCGYIKPEKIVRVTLKRNKREIASLLLHRGYALFEEIPVGHYSLDFVKDEVLLGTCFFEI